ncbi:ABC transporter related protein [Magnetococcus marinus MC-1]|uniref:ABC transporter related protein n=1 Tax=Magnetococcus marinus (strain ATCC BAA-1437 / JCM 17883 / MC-1) TaxID=156889 RepID=A0LE12_MAGMM|nr:ATP-binding cassette domain-containing protein [Magnetococcus marinus]ABK46205.1 ABC transporter related protein [Magnetococcus marinus MC-1]
MSRSLRLSLQDVVWAPAMAPISLTVEGGSSIAIVGEEGVGKSRLLRVMAGLLPAEQGVVVVDGKPLGQWSAAERAQRLGVLFHQPERHFLTAHVGDEVGFGCEPALSGPLDARVQPWLACCGVEAAWWSRPLNQLSAAQRARVALLSVLLHQPPLLLADEPGNALSEAGEVAWADCLKQRPGGLVVFTSRLSRARAFAESIYQLSHQGLIPLG